MALLYLFLFYVCLLRGRPWPSVKSSRPLAPHRFGFESRHGLWIISCEDAIQLVYEMSVVLLRCQVVPEIMSHKLRSSPVKLGTFVVLQSTETQPKMSFENTLIILFQ